MDSTPSLQHVGIGLRQPHYRDFQTQPPALPFVEVHSENFFAEGGAALQVLLGVRAHCDVSLHGVGLSLGSAVGLDPLHLDQLARLVRAVQPVRVSDHASFARAPRRHGQAPVHAADLLPVAFTEASLSLMVANVQQVQERLQRPLLVENLSAYLRWADDTLAEPQFFNELAQRSGCGLLLDLNNLVVNALNAQGPTTPEHPRDETAALARACAWVDALQGDAVGEIHLAGYADLGDLVVDDHGSAVHAPVWALYRHTLQRLGPRPTLVEWDTDVPPLAVMLAEAQQAEQLVLQVQADAAAAHAANVAHAAKQRQPAAWAQPV
jgi:uncharacterized protein (UPF0276 family)